MNEEYGQAKNRAALLSLLAACLLTAIKLVVGIATNSLGILSEALHSGLDLLAAAMTLYAVRISSRPADDRHPYGHGKIENLSALGETVLLFVICIWVVYEGVGRLLSGDTPVAPSIWGIIVMGISIVIDVNRVRVLKKVAKETRSQALEADALHFSTDILSSAVVLVGVGAVWLAAKLQLPEPVHRVLVQADTVAALLVALIIFRASLHMAREAINMLMDSGSTEEQQAICEAVKRLPGVQDVQRVRLRSSGPHYFVDLTVGVDPAIRVSAGHKIAHDAELAVDGILPGADVTVHVEPVRSGQKEDPFAVVQRVASIQGLAIHDVQILRSGRGRLWRSMWKYRGRKRSARPTNGSVPLRRHCRRPCRRPGSSRTSILKRAGMSRRKRHLPRRPWRILPGRKWNRPLPMSPCCAAPTTSMPIHCRYTACASPSTAVSAMS